MITEVAEAAMQGSRRGPGMWRHGGIHTVNLMSAELRFGSALRSRDQTGVRRGCIQTAPIEVRVF